MHSCRVINACSCLNDYSISFTGYINFLSYFCTLNVYSVLLVILLYDFNSHALPFDLIKLSLTEMLYILRNFFPISIAYKGFALLCKGRLFLTIIFY